jgi:hypothetical protein
MKMKYQIGENFTFRVWFKYADLENIIGSLFFEIPDRFVCIEFDLITSSWGTLINIDVFGLVLNE